MRDVARAERLGRLHELELAHDEHLAANEPRHPRPADDADGEEHDAVSDGCSAAAIAMSSSSVGNASVTSARRITSSSTQPP